MARRGYGCRLSTPVVEGTGVDLVQLGQGSYAPAMTMARRGYGCRLSTPVVEGTGVDLVQLGQGSYAPAMTMARRGYGCRLSTPVVEGTGVDLVQLGQGSYAPARVIGMVRLNWFRHGRTNVLLPRAHFSPKSRDRRLACGIALSRPTKTAPSAIPKKAAPFLSLASAARS
jgi:hypothetical protein